MEKKDSIDYLVKENYVAFAQFEEELRNLEIGYDLFAFIKNEKRDLIDVFGSAIGVWTGYLRHREIKSEETLEEEEGLVEIVR